MIDPMLIGNYLVSTIALTAPDTAANIHFAAVVSLIPVPMTTLYHFLNHW